MRLILTLLCRDEEDIIDEMLSFHLQHGVDLVIATDNDSQDATRSILERYREAGSLVLLDEARHMHDQGPWVTRMARMAATEYGADWVIHADADEFWWPRNGDLKQELTGVDSTVKVLRVERTNFLPPDLDSSPCLPFYRTMTLRERQSRNSLGSPLPPKVCHRADRRICVTDGNHAVRIDGAELPASRSDTIEILHFPVRSYRQFERKIRDGSQALENNSRTVNSSIGNSWRHLYHHFYLTGGLPCYYNSLRPSAVELLRQVESGALIDDRRLQFYFQSLVESTPDLSAS